MYKVATDRFLALSITLIDGSSETATLKAALLDNNASILDTKLVNIVNGSCTSVQLSGDSLTSSTSDQPSGFTALIAACPNGISVVDMEAHLISLAILPEAIS